MTDLWQKLGTELDSIRLLLQLGDMQKVMAKDFAHVKNYKMAHRRLDALALFAKRAADIIQQLEKGGEVVQQSKWNDPIAAEGVEGGHVLGNHAKVGFPAFNVSVEGKIDTGATTSSLHATDISAKGGRVSFKSEVLSRNVITLPVEGTQEVHSADFGGDKRPVVRLDVEIDGVPIKGVMFNLNDRSQMDSKLLIGQDVLKAGNFHVDVSKNEERPADQAMPESTQSTDEAKIYEAIQILAASDITLSDLIRYLQTEAVNRIKE
jgi:hypothetical protein